MNSTNLSRLLPLLPLMLLGACAGGPRGNITTNPVELQAPDPAIDNIYVTDYLLQPSDELDITVFRVPELSGSYKVDTSGYLTMPLIGPITAIRKTTRQLSSELEQLYGARYLEMPDITIQIKKAQGQTLTIEGAVKDPGVFAIDGKTSLLGAIAIANGLDMAVANPKRVVVFRKINGENFAAAFDLRQVREGLQPNPDIYGGDIIVVDGSNLRRDILDVLKVVPLLGLFTRI